MNRLIFRLLFICICLCLTTNISAQEKKECVQDELHKPLQKHKELIKAQKIAFLTEYLDLSENEAEKFWPVYNKYWKKRMQAHGTAKLEQHKLNDKLNSNTVPTDTEIKSMIEKCFALMHEEGDIMKEMMDEIMTILPVRKAAKLLNAEDVFRERLIRQLKNNK